MRFYALGMLIITSFLISCDMEHQENLKLTEKLNKLKKISMNLEKDVEKYKKEQEKVLQSSVKERFAFFYKFTLQKEILLKYLNNFVSIQWFQKTKNSYVAEIKIRPFYKKFEPYFLIYLYDEEGLIIESYHVKPKLIGGIIPQGKLVKNDYTIKLSKNITPVYFGFGYVNR